MIDPPAPQPESATAGPLVAVLTPRGRGAVASIRLRGDSTLLDQDGTPLFRSVNGKPLAELPPFRVVFGRWGSEPGEEVVVCRNAIETIDIHCHGGDAAVCQILADLESAGCRIVSWQAMEVAAGSLFETECREALANAPTLRTANILLEQCSGTLRTAIETLRDRLERGDLADGVARIEALLDSAEFGTHLTVSWKVVILGRPNVGKSSLLNALAGFDRAIVWDEPGTTRDALTVETAFQGWPVRLVDTAGIRDTDESLESAGIARSRQEGASADCRLIVVDTGQPPQPEDWELLAAWPESFVVAHKADLPDVWQARIPKGALPVSARTGSGIETLIDKITETLVGCMPPAGTAMPLVARHVALLKLAREALLAGDRNAGRTAVIRILNEGPAARL